MGLVTDVRLLPTDDRGYRRWQRAMRRQHEKSKQKCSFSQEYNLALLQLERKLYAMLGEYAPSCDNRILSFSTPTKKGIPAIRYRELDFVAGEPESPRLIVETKLRERAGPRFKGVAQLNSALRVARERWPKVNGLFLCVYMGEVLGLEGQDAPELADLSKLDSWRPENDAAREEVEKVWIDGHLLFEPIDFPESEVDFNATELRQLRLLAEQPTQILAELNEPSGASLGDIWPKGPG